MREHLYIRFFVNAYQAIPFSCNKVCHKNNLESSRDAVELGRDVVDWMTRHPNGKVDFVWATYEGIM